MQFLSLGKNLHDQIRMTDEGIANQKCMSEEIPSLLQWKSRKLDILAISWKYEQLKTAPLKSVGAKDPVCKYLTNLIADYFRLNVSNLVKK